MNARRGWLALLGASILGILTAWWGTKGAPVPTATEGIVIVPVWRLLAMGSATLPVLVLHSRLADLETTATARLRSCQRNYLVGMSLCCSAIYLGICAIALQPPVLAIIARSWIAWCGLALFAGAVFGWRLAWTLPATVSVVLAYWGYHGAEQYRWWEFSARPYDDVPSLLFSVGLLGLGVAAYAATPWRLRSIVAWRARGPDRR